MMWMTRGRRGMDAAGWMRRAIEIAYRGKGSVHPNPLVGCVLVRDGEIIAEGWHGHLGGLHAEQAAIADAEEKGISTSGSTACLLYTSPSPRDDELSRMPSSA